ncbi:unnamed protein product [Paramecium sonneborni]|uniref:Uncharacterized protein n=1 Tax=Paramecium sonneborni TaxID=65129 RepID=A0A8S1LZ06_9CILI|nr:unnamed protein product [Paramecium sonneborni]
MQQESINLQSLEKPNIKTKKVNNIKGLGNIQKLSKDTSFGEEHKQNLEDRLRMHNYLKEAQNELINIVNSNKEYMIFSSYDEMKSYRQKCNNKQQETIFKPLSFPVKGGSVIRCKKILLNTTPEEMTSNYGILTLKQKIKANKVYYENQKSMSPLKLQLSDEFHHIEGKIAKQNRIEFIKEFSKIYKRVQVKASKKQMDESQYFSKYRQAVQKIQVFNQRKSGKNMLPVLQTERTESVKSILSDLNYSRWSLDQDVSYIHIPDQKFKLQQRIGGGFTRPTQEKLLDYFYK